jgi:hypothetical protein
MRDPVFLESGAQSANAGNAYRCRRRRDTPPPYRRRTFTCIHSRRNESIVARLAHTPHHTKPLLSPPSDQETETQIPTNNQGTSRTLLSFHLPFLRPRRADACSPLHSSTKFSSLRISSPSSDHPPRPHSHPTALSDYCIPIPPTNDSPLPSLEIPTKPQKKN